MIGFIGAGNMASALIQGMIGGGVPCSTIAAYDTNPQRMQEMKLLGIHTVESIDTLAAVSDTLVLSVKPKQMQTVIDALHAAAKVPDVLSIAVGWTQEMLQNALPQAAGIAHAMPNTPVRVQAGVIAFNDNHSIDSDRFNTLQRLFASCAKVFVLPEAYLDAVVGVSGSGPAYVYIFLEAMADAGVREGLPRDTAYALAAQTALGASKMVLEGTHPAVLKDSVCSPGGTTIEAVYALEKGGLRAAVMDAVHACTHKASRMARRRRKEG